MLTKAFKDTLQARVRRDPSFRDALLTETVEALLKGDMATGKAMLRIYIDARFGLRRLRALTGHSRRMPFNSD